MYNIIRRNFSTVFRPLIYFNLPKRREWQKIDKNNLKLTDKNKPIAIVSDEIKEIELTKNIKVVDTTYFKIKKIN